MQASLCNPAAGAAFLHGEKAPLRQLGKHRAQSVAADSKATGLQFAKQGLSANAVGRLCGAVKDA